MNSTASFTAIKREQFGPYFTTGNIVSDKKKYNFLGIFQ